MKSGNEHTPRRAVRRILTAVTALVLWCAHADARGGPLVVRGDNNYPPYEFQGEHGPDGFNVELFRAVAAAVGLDYELRLGVWDEVRGELENRRIDALTGMYYSRDRDRTVDFTAPHSIVTHSIFVRKGSSIQSLADLRGKEIIVQRGDIMHDFVRDFGFVVHVVPVADQREALTLLASGRHDAALLSKLQGLYHARKLRLDNITTVGDPIMPRDYCFAVREGDTRLAARLNEGLRIVRETGEYHRIHRKWFGGGAEISTGDFARYTAYAGGIALFVVLLILTWSWSLKSQVHQKTVDLERELEERRRVETELRTSEERLRGIVQNMPVMMDAFDTEEVLAVWNAECERVTGYSAGEMVGNPDAMRLLYPEPGRLEEIMAEFRRSEGRFRNWRLALRCKDGSERIIEWSSIAKEFPIMGWSAWSVGVDVTDRVRADEQVRQSLAEKEVLLKEIHHRVKNNLQIIHSLLNLQADHSGGTTAEVFRDVQSRVMAMALIHEKLYKSADFIHIDYAAYLKALLRDLVRTYSQPARAVSIRSDIDDIELTIDRAIPCGLVVTEIVSNALKHAFPPGWEGEPVLRLALKSENGSTVRLVIEDNGIGLPAGMREEGTGSLGMLLIGRLAEGQLGARLAVESNGGTRYEIVFSRE
jgi:PAS domain S-box-containing protein